MANCMDRVFSSSVLWYAFRGGGVDCDPRQLASVWTLFMRRNVVRYA